MAIACGSVVQLKTGGPKMTVQEVMGSQIRVKWFDGSVLREEIVKASSLKETSLNEQILFG